MYGNEAVVGAGLAEFLAAGKRSELFITSKVWNTHHKPADARYVSTDPSWFCWCCSQHRKLLCRASALATPVGPHAGPPMLCLIARSKHDRRVMLACSNSASQPDRCHHRSFNARQAALLLFQAQYKLCQHAQIVVEVDRALQCSPCFAINLMTPTHPPAHGGLLLSAGRQCSRA